MQGRDQPASADFETAWRLADAVPGWLTKDQGRLLFEEATAAGPRARLLEILQDRCRELGIRLHFQTERSLEELADELQVSRTTAYNWLSRFRSALRRELQGEAGDDV